MESYSDTAPPSKLEEMRPAAQWMQKHTTHEERWRLAQKGNQDEDCENCMA